MVATPGQIRPWRYLAAFVGIIAVLYALVFFTGDGKAKPKLGIDLEGGTRVTLTARTTTGAPPSKEQLNLAREIIDKRVNGLGVSGAEVVQDGNNLTITVPGDQGEKAKDLGQTAQLRFRAVLAGPIPVEPTAAPGTAGSGGQPGDKPGDKPKPATPAAPSKAPGPGSAAPHTVGPDLAQPAPNPPAPGPGEPDVGDPELAKQISAARATRQSTNEQVQAAALEKLQCTSNDVLRGYDDPTKPLVACDQKGTEKYVLGPSFIEGTEIESAAAAPNQRGAGYAINMTFKPEGARVWADQTTANNVTLPPGPNMHPATAFVLDAQVVSAPSAQGPIVGGNTEITGKFSQAEAQNLAGVLKYGSLPLSFATSDAETVSATLGLASLEAGLLAGGIGLLLVFIYCLFYYRALGVLTILSLVLSGAIVYAILVLLGRSLGFTLDLAGVAGFIVAIGITADSFVIFFERLKDEVREGRSFKAAVPRGWVRARRTILSADAVSFLASAVLYVLAVGQVKGFAFTLGMSTVLDLIVVFLVTHPLVALASQSKVLSSPRWSGLGAVAKIGAVRRRAAAAAAKGA